MSHRKNKMVISAARQLAILFEYGVNAIGHSYTLADAAATTGISYQALMNLLKGKTASPRLNTARALCQLYGISLNYFDLETEEDCRSYLLKHQQQFATSPIGEIAALSNQLSPRGQRNILTILQWIRAGKTHLASSI